MRRYAVGLMIVLSGIVLGNVLLSGPAYAQHSGDDVRLAARARDGAGERDREQSIQNRKTASEFCAGGKYFAEAPDGGPEWGIRVVITFLFPKK